MKESEKVPSYPLDIKVLMAEDDELNQALSRNVFKKIGWTLDIAENGAVAVEKVKRFDYDVVLMDLQMPVMNGFNATALIRKGLQPPKCRIPIIAITAEVQDSVLEECFSTGMNDYISKPFKVNELIAKVCLHARNIKPADNAATRVAVTEEGIMNLDNLYKMYGNSQAAVNEIVSLFLKQTPERIEEIRRLIKAADWATLGLVCHKVKSSYAIVGSLAIRDQLEHIELDCAKNNIDAGKFESIMEAVVEMNASLTEKLRKIVDA